MQMPLTLSARRVAVLVATLALLVAGALVLGDASGAGARSTARLALVKGNPVTVSGHGFRAHARVHLILVADGTCLTPASDQPLRSVHGHLPGRDRSLQRMVGDRDPARPHARDPAQPGQAGVRAAQSPVAPRHSG